MTWHYPTVPLSTFPHARRLFTAALLTTMNLLATSGASADAPTDPFQWLEDVDGAAAMAWVRERNEASRSLLTARPEYAALKPRLRAMLDSQQRIPTIGRIGAHVYNFWQDAANPRGLWRRTTLEDYRKPAPAWETVLDVDALGRADQVSWVWHGSTCLPPAWRRCLISLSRGGGDAHVVREFDLVSKQFIAASDGGFELPEAKSDVQWLDADTLLVGTDTGPGSLTTSGYPRTVLRWRRGTPLSAAEMVFEGDAADVAVGAGVDHTPGYPRVVFSRALDFYRNQEWLLRDGQRIALPKPDDASLSLHREWATLRLRSDFESNGQRFPSGALLITRLDDWLAGRAQWTALFTPGPERSLSDVDWSRDHLLLTVMDRVANQVEELYFDGKAWQRRSVAVPGPGTLSLSTLHDPHTPNDPWAESYLLNYADFLTPDSLMLGRTGRDDRELLKSRESFFDSSALQVEQRWVTSADGTRVPYFLVRGRPAVGSPEQATPKPTLLYGYGGFEVSLQPWYSGAYGVAWFAQGGVLAVANIRGGGEFGPAWHQAAVKAHKQRSYDDFIAVAEDLTRSGVTTPQQLGIMGGSNGGLLVGAAFTQRPDLFGAVVCQVPLLDMQRYHRLLAGASWMAEYGNPDLPEEWAWISGYSPYQKVQPGVRYPRVLFTTSTRDDRVHPGHARKMVAKMMAQGHPVLYVENTEGGHAGAADNEQRAHLLALEYTYLWMELGGATFTSTTAPAAGQAPR